MPRTLLTLTRAGPPGTSLMDAERTELMVRLLTRHQDDLFRYAFSLLPHEEDARDALQETNLALCRKFAEYDRNQPFLAWACGFAYLECLKQRSRSRRGALLFDDELMARLAEERAALEPKLAARLQALELCLEELPPASRELVRLRYVGKVGTDELVKRSGVSRRTMFRRLDEIRGALHECIGRRTPAM
ncbi:MAG: sigma-70 family RNA polymerase sigma factor [Gemmataceae bacterium]